ncbi:MAG: exodeoxyribonuclease VII small subunit [Gammaproteobacteria bacterium]|jgi:exodeoxyribonuclease VII small subunit
MATQTTKKPTLEKSLADLEKIVEKMESGQLSLEESLKLFEQGVTLIASCQKMLSDAKQKIAKLTNKKGSLELAEYLEEK